MEELRRKIERIHAALAVYQQLLNAAANRDVGELTSNRFVHEHLTKDHVSSILAYWT